MVLPLPLRPLLAHTGFVSPSAFFMNAPTSSTQKQLFPSEQKYFPDYSPAFSPRFPVFATSQVDKAV